MGALFAVRGGILFYEAFSDVILESKNVVHLKIEEPQATHPTRLKISGFAFNSSMGVRKITTKIEGSAVVVSVHLSMADREAGGNFAYELTVPDSVDEVRFGTSKTLIWKRHPLPPEPNAPNHIQPNRADRLRTSWV
ncbi:MAG: hypothetical protein JOZ43_03740 [Acidobacteriales bacterium]|nr:hypothetical protein [Terriglobales bacterium]